MKMRVLFTTACALLFGVAGAASPAWSQAGVSTGGPGAGTTRVTRVTLSAPPRERAPEPNTLELHGNARGPLVSKAGSGASLSTPTFHTVRRGDTLWGLCESYFRDPWRWPRLWAMNPSITNPHWIYPGDRIRLRKGGAKPPPAPAIRAYSPKAQQLPGTIYLKQRGFIEEEELKYAAKIAGSREEKILLATYDQIYIKYPRNKPLKVGDRYDIYKALKPVVHPGNKRTLGQMVEIYGEVQINELSRANIARGTILRAINPIERGYLVGKLKRKFKAVQPIRNTRTRVKGSVVAVMGNIHLIGTKMLVFLDRGRKFNIKVGYTFFVTRRGDSYRGINTFHQQTKPAERKWPRQFIASIVVVDVGWHHSVGYVSKALKEIRLGDRVELLYHGVVKR